MKSELELQKLVVDAVNGAGGFAHKMNNRFLIGVSDLIVKLPDSGRVFSAAGFLEVKQMTRPRVADDAPFAVEITSAQRRFLQATHDAGMPAGVLSFLQRGAGNRLQIWICIHAWIDYCHVPFFLEDYVELGHKDQRDAVILTCLHNWLKEWREGR